MRIRALFYALCVLAIGTAAGAQTSADETLVASLFPAALVDGSAPHLYAYGRADLNGTGSADHIVAVYSNGSRGLVRVIRSSQVVDETHYDLMLGITPLLRLIDVDGDGKPEIIASFATMGGQITWPLKWSGGHMTLIGPAEAVPPSGALQTLLGYVELFDVDGDGKLDLIEPVRNSANRIVLKLGADGKYASIANKVVWVGRFVRHEGDPEIFTGVFSASAGTKLTIIVVNGDGAGNNRVTSGDFFFNGKQLLSPSDFKKSNRAFTLSVTAVGGLNEVESGLQGKPGTELTVSVSPQQ